MLSVLPSGGDQPQERVRLERFLQAGVRSLALLGIAATIRIRAGAVFNEVTDEMASGAHDLLVIGAPLSERDGHLAFAGVAGQLVSHATTYPVLIVRSRYALGNQRWLARNGRINIISEEVIR